MILRSLLAVAACWVVATPVVLSAELSAAATRGRKALTTRAFNTATWSLEAYDNIWRHWGAKEKPANYDTSVQQHYGLHPAPFANGKYPLGLREGPGLIAKGIAADCMLCHGGSILGKSYIGLGNSTLDIEALFSDFNKASGGSGDLPFTFSNVRGTSEAAAFAVFLMSLRDPDLKFRLKRRETELHTDLCEDVPAWWLLKKKKTMYFTGSTPAKSVRSIMQFMLGSTKGPKEFDKEEATFRDIQAFILSLEAPKYPFAINRELAQRGEKLFRKNCSTCHGTYGEKWTYPNKVVPLSVIGTDRRRYDGLPKKWAIAYNESWFAKEKKGWFGYEYKVRETKGYQAPPLDGVWATAPYLHNGSVPTLYHMLKSKARPVLYTRSFGTAEADYDKQRVGWKFRVLKRVPVDLSAYQRRKIYDTRLAGRGNQGHTFGDDLSEPQRRAVIEYLKTL